MDFVKLVIINGPDGFGNIVLNYLEDNCSWENGDCFGAGFFSQGIKKMEQKILSAIQLKFGTEWIRSLIKLIQ